MNEVDARLTTLTSSKKAIHQCLSKPIEDIPMASKRMNRTPAMAACILNRSYSTRFSERVPVMPAREDLSRRMAEDLRKKFKFVCLNVKNIIGGRFALPWLKNLKFCIKKLVNACSVLFKLFLQQKMKFKFVSHTWSFRCRSLRGDPAPWYTPCSQSLKIIKFN